MNNYDTNISGAEFRKRLEENDEVCVLANALLKESFAYTITDLTNAKNHTRFKFMEEAKRLIKNLNNHDLHIIHKEKL